MRAPAAPRTGRAAAAAIKDSNVRLEICMGCLTNLWGGLAACGGLVTRPQRRHPAPQPA